MDLIYQEIEEKKVSFAEGEDDICKVILQAAGDGRVNDMRGGEKSECVGKDFQIGEPIRNRLQGKRAAEMLR